MEKACLIEVKCDLPGCNNIKLKYPYQIIEGKRNYCCLKHRYKHHSMLMKGSGNPMYGISRKHTKKEKQKISEASIKLWKDPEYREKVMENAKKITDTFEYKERHRQITKARWNDPNSIFYTEEYREALIKGLNKPELKMIRIKTGKSNWKNPEIRNKMLKSFDRSPTKPEKVFDEITPNNVRYVGNGDWHRWTGKQCRIPDFKVTGQNKLIEIYGDYWHRDDDPQDIIQEYKEVGLDCLVFWEHEVYKEPERVLKETLEFIENI